MRITTFALLAIASFGLIAGLTAVTMLDSLRREIAAIKRDVAASRSKAAELEFRLEGLARVPQSGAASPKETGSVSAFELGREEIRLVRDYIKVPPAAPGNAPTMRIGDEISNVRLLPLPPQIGDQIPKLKGATFTTDQTGAVIIVRRGSNRVDAVIAPR